MEFLSERRVCATSSGDSICVEATLQLKVSLAETEITVGETIDAEFQAEPSGLANPGIW